MITVLNVFGISVPTGRYSCLVAKGEFLWNFKNVIVVIVVPLLSVMKDQANSYTSNIGFRVFSFGHI